MQMPQCDCWPAGSCRHSPARDRQVVEAGHARHQGTKRHRPVVKTSGTCPVASAPRRPRPTPCRTKGAFSACYPVSASLCETLIGRSRRYKSAPRCSVDSRFSAYPIQRSCDKPVRGKAQSDLRAMCATRPVLSLKLRTITEKILNCFFGERNAASTRCRGRLVLWSYPL